MLTVAVAVQSPLSVPTGVSAGVATGVCVADAERVGVGLVVVTNGELPQPKKRRKITAPIANPATAGESQ
jgi:hypothetical protein